MLSSFSVPSSKHFASGSEHKTAQVVQNVSKAQYRQYDNHTQPTLIFSQWFSIFHLHFQTTTQQEAISSSVLTPGSHWKHMQYKPLAALPSNGIREQGSLNYTRYLTQLEAELPCLINFCSSASWRVPSNTSIDSTMASTQLRASSVWCRAALLSALTKLAHDGNTDNIPVFCSNLVSYPFKTQDQSDYTPSLQQNYFHQLMEACPHSWKVKRWNK